MYKGRTIQYNKVCIVPPSIFFLHRVSLKGASIYLQADKINAWKEIFIYNVYMERNIDFFPGNHDRVMSVIKGVKDNPCDIVPEASP
jgi:hypothetical protein